jgi:crotonobetainyl-CoA:carnitine CoA-transferase CaiB-like acyl-CoA transferase
VLIENFRPGVLTEVGFTETRLKIKAVPLTLS